MRSTPSLDRGRFTLPRDLFAAVATGATLTAAVLVLGWMTSGLITGVWSPRAHAATVTDGVVALAAPSDREDAPRAARTRAVAPSEEAQPRPTVARANAVRGERRSRRAAPRTRRRAAAAPSAPSPAAPAPVATPAPTATPVATAVPVSTPVATVEESTEAISQRQATQVSARTPEGWREDESGNDDDRGNGRRWRPRGHDRRGAVQPTPTPVSTPAPADDEDDDRHGWDGGDDDRRGWDRHDGDDRRGDGHHGRGRR